MFDSCTLLPLAVLLPLSTKTYVNCSNCYPSWEELLSSQGCFKNLVNVALFSNTGKPSVCGGRVQCSVFCAVRGKLNFRCSSCELRHAMHSASRTIREKSNAMSTEVYSLRRSGSTTRLQARTGWNGVWRAFSSRPERVDGSDMK